MLKLYFCFPYRGVGGVSMLFLRMAEEMAAKGMAETWLVDYADGFMARHHQQGLTKFLEYRDDSEVNIPADAIAVFQSMTPWSIFPSLRLAPATRILYWNCYPFNLVPMLPGLRRVMQHNAALARIILATLLRSYRNKMVRLVRLMLARHALVFMDRPNVAVTSRYLGISVAEPVYLPIPAGRSNRCAQERTRDFGANGLHFVWIGRVVDFKYYILKHALVELNSLQPDLALPLEVTIVGSGDYHHTLQDDARQLGHLKIEFIEHVPPGELDDFLLQRADILLAMGTSALEGAKLGLPTLLLDVAHGPVPVGYRFQWLHERSGYTLGDVLGEEHVGPGNRSLAERIGEAMSDYPCVSSRAVEYFEKNHELSAVAERFLVLARASSCTYADFTEAKMTERGWLYSVFAYLRKGLVKA